MIKPVDQGFTLLELLVVLLLVSILSVTAVLYLKPTNHVLLEANDIKIFVQQTRNQAVLHSRSYRIELIENELKVWKWTEKKWVESSHSYIVDNDDISVRDVGLNHSKTGRQLIVFSDGTLTPFTWQLDSQQQPDNAYTVEGDLLGNIKLEPFISP